MAERDFKGAGDLVDRRSRSRPAPTCRRCCRPVMQAAARSTRFEAMVAKLQDAMLAHQATRWCRWSPRCAGMALGGGCEFADALRRARVAALESYIGLVEVGVGLLPARRRPEGARACARREARRPRAATCSRSSRRRSKRRDGQGRRRQRDRSEASSGYLRDGDVDRVQRATSCCTSRGSRHARWPKPATARRCPRADPGRRPTSASRPSRCSWSTCATAASSREHDYQIAHAHRRRAVRRRRRARHRWSTRSGCSTSSASTSCALRDRSEDAGADRGHAARPASRCGTDEDDRP